MNKFLRYSLSLVLAFVASVTFAGTTPYKVLTSLTKVQKARISVLMTKPGRLQSEKMFGLLRISTQTSGTTIGNTSDAEVRKSHL